MNRCNACEHSHPGFLPHEETLRYWKLMGDIVIAGAILFLVLVAIKKRGIVKTASQVP